MAADDDEDVTQDRTRLSPTKVALMAAKVNEHNKELYGGDGEDGLRKRMSDMEKKHQFLQGVVWVLGALGAIVMFILDKVF